MLYNKDNEVDPQVKDKIHKIGNIIIINKLKISWTSLTPVTCQNPSLARISSQLSLQLLGNEPVNISFFIFYNEGRLQHGSYKQQCNVDHNNYQH